MLEDSIQFFHELEWYITSKTSAMQSQLASRR